MYEDELRRVEPEARGHRSERDARSLPPVVPGGDPLIGCLVDGRYRVTRLIASGGMGCVYEGTDRQRGGSVALKTLLPRFSEEAELVRRFHREARTLARAKSPHMAAVAGQGRLPDGRAYYAMEYLEGDCLADVIEERGGPMDPAEVVLVGLQLATALGHAHALGVIHRDLKPENVLLCPGGDDERPTVKLVDFGLAKLTDGSMDITEAGHVLGTPGYMAPEQIRGQPVDERADIYGCGVLLYEMLTGRLPFAAEDIVDLMLAQVGTPTPLPSHLDPPVQLPPLLEWIVMCCLYNAPARRFQTASELRAELRNAARLYRLV